MMAAIGVREEGVGRNRGGKWGRENIQYVRNVMFDFKYGSVRSPGGGEVYICARDGTHVRYISTISASLTRFLTAMSAPFFKSREQISS